ncbi:hypothetical protein BDZ97DRAFT_1921203 [Flammula alnicola]|nr:hypothetical protein BDZ97DRAFT_1921203 [Flammula alnicola]
MRIQKKQTLPESDGEEFSDISSDSDTGSETGIPEDSWIFPVVAPNAKRNDYDAALKEAQLKVSELQMTIRKLYMQNADLSTRLKKNNPKACKNRDGNKEELSDSDKRVSQIAKLFGVMHEPFVTQPALLVERPPVDSAHPDRYKSDLSMLQGITAELYEVVPSDLHEDLKSSPAFRSLLASGRRSMLYQLRSKTASEIFCQPSKYYSVKFLKREKIPAFQEKLKFPGDKEYPKYAPILFPNGRREMKNLFRCVELTEMLKSILFGPTSLSSDKPPSRITQGRVWGTTFVTPGAIAHMAVLAIFLHSPDTELASIGAKSNIPYEKWFNLYKDFLTKHATKPNIKALYMWWNGRVFSFDTAAKKVDGDGEESSGMEEAELGLDADEDSGFENSLPGDRQDYGWGSMAEYPTIRNDEDLIDGFKNLAVDVPEGSNQPFSSSRPSSISAGILSSNSVAPGPSRLSSSQLVPVPQPDDPAEQRPAPRQIANTSKRLIDENPKRGKGNMKGKQRAVEADSEAVAEEPAKKAVPSFHLYHHKSLPRCKSDTQVDLGPLSSISASPPESASRPTFAADCTSYDSVIGKQRSSLENSDSIFERTGYDHHRESISSDSVFGDDFAQVRKDGLLPPVQFRHLSIRSSNSVHSPMKEDDTMINMLGGGGHVRCRSIEASPCPHVEKRKHSATQGIQMYKGQDHYDSPNKARIIKKPSIASTSSFQFRGERMIKAQHGLLECQSLEDSCLIADGEELSAYRAVPVFLDLDLRPLSLSHLHLELRH